MTEACTSQDLAHQFLDDVVKANRVAADLREKGYRFYEADDGNDPIRFIILRQGRVTRVALRPTEEADVVATVTEQGIVKYG